MQPAESRSEAVPVQTPAWAAVLLLLCAATIFLAQHAIGTTRSDFLAWVGKDAHVYDLALLAWNIGQDPYAAPFGPFHFVYPPIFFYLFGGLVRLLAPIHGAVLYCAVLTAVSVGLPVIVARRYLRLPWLGALFAIAVFFSEPGLAAIAAAVSGNLALPLYTLVLIASLPGLQRQRWLWFYLAVFIASLIKLPFVLFLLLPLLLGRRQLLKSTMCAVGIGASYWLQSVFLSELYAKYQANLNEQLWQEKDVGYGFFGLAASVESRLRHTVGVSSAVLAGLSVVLILGALWIVDRRKQGEQGVGQHALVLLAVILLNPRLLVYDSCVGLLVAFAIFVQVFRVRFPIALVVALYLPSLVIPHFVHNAQVWGGYETFLMSAAFVLGVRSFWRTPTQNSTGV